MTQIQKLIPSRRRLLQALLALPALPLFLRNARPTEDDEIVEVDGWILKRSDLS